MSVSHSEQIMKLIKILLLLTIIVVILAVGVWFLEVDKWTNEVIQTSNMLPIQSINKSFSISDNSTCDTLVSHKLSKYVPYKETYRRSWGFFYRTMTRINYKVEYYTEWKIEHTCCNGYRQYGTQCKPYCEQSCEKGSCVKPNVCMCNNGYQMPKDINEKKSCVPVCKSECINGACVEPDICVCNDGYWMDSDGFTCRPICNEECERNYGFCPQPYTCACRSGYKKVDDILYNCQPICDRACTNGYCTAPNTCKCKDGYEPDDFDSRFTCKPKCNETCIFGKCTAPEICTCNNGYEAVTASVCEPICSVPCKMGTCIAPESCSCIDGYGLLGESKYVCEPICEMNCGNGICTAPGVCTCNNGFVYDNHTNETCKPHCEIPCGLYGTCTSPNNCTCVEGYQAITWNELNNTSINNQTFLESTSEELYSVCQPVCDFDCINGKCIAPNVCTCAIGYSPNWTEVHQQLPLFDNGTIERLCEPVCKASCGNNGKCIAPDICICNYGYRKDINDNCVPFCADECHNGICTEPNLCKCNDGFAALNESVCEPICENGCQNGDCVAPNHCICHDNFILNIKYPSMAECIPACTRNCSGHGTCVFNNEYSCKCHFGWTGWNCDQPTMCVITIDLDHSYIDRITICNDTNSTILQTHEDAPHCYHCDEFLNKESLCYMIYSDEANTTSITACLLSTDLPCYMTSHYNTSSRISMIAWPLAVVIILIATSITVATYIFYRKHQKKKLTTGNKANNFLQESFATEFLLSENVIYL